MTQQEIAKYIDLDTGLGRVRGNKNLYKRMLGMFAAAAEFDAFEQALAAGDISHAAEVAHAIKGMTGNLALTVVFEKSTKLMETLRVGEVDQNLIAEYREALTATKECVAQLAEELV